jgi:signal transduction histidine kinase
MTHDPRPAVRSHARTVVADSGGIGLGLFIARAVVSAHGSAIAVTSSSDDGTTFTVWLPKGLA